ncbi:MAG: hypothetical protein IJF32_05725 [Oscillospiraceae bacterium]|nr:hypothetical protein [Oscillospiraceae bacterium]
MTNSKATKKALFMSIISLLLCFTMLMGATFAWFTDTVTSSNNKIIAGNLDVQLLMDTDVNGEYETEITDVSNPIFGAGSIAANNNAETLWEPGKTQVAYLAIKNNGSLTLKYKVEVDVENGAKDLYKVMRYAIIPDATKDNPVTAWNAENGKEVQIGVNETGYADIQLDPGKEHYFALAIHMQEEATNEYQDGEVSFDIIVNATQKDAESDSFDNTYDNKAVYKEDVQEEAQPWHELDAVQSNTVVDGGGNTYAAEYQEVCLAGNADITIKGVTFQNGLTLYTNTTTSKGTITLENCVVYLNDGNGNPDNASLNMHYADYGLYIGAISPDVNYVFKNCKFTAYDSHVYTNVDKGYNVYIGGNYSADSITFEGCTFEKSSKHGIGCSFGYIPDYDNNIATYYNLTVTGCNFVDWNNGNYNGAAIRGNVPAEVLTQFNKTITISGNTFGNNNGSTKANVAIDSWTGSWN